MRKIKMLAAAAAITLSGGLAATTASAAQLAPTEVTIQGPGGDFSGYVNSSDPLNCEDGRKVTVFKLLGKSPNRHVDQKIGSDTADADGAWSTGNSGYKKGKFYARAGKTPYCQGDVSPVIKLTP